MPETKLVTKRCVKNRDSNLTPLRLRPARAGSTQTDSDRGHPVTRAIIRDIGTAPENPATPKGHVRRLGRLTSYARPKLSQVAGHGVAGAHFAQGGTSILHRASAYGQRV